MIRVTVFKSVEVDSYNDGCQLEGGSDFGVIEKVEFTTVEKALQFIRTFGDAEIFEEETGRMELDAQENEDGETPTAAQWAAFKAGEINLYLARYSFYVEAVERRPVDLTALSA